MNKLKLYNIVTIATLIMIPVFSHAAIITVTADHGLIASDGACSISEAIINANDDAQTHSDCPAGSGVDTINLSQNITLTTQIDSSPIHGRTGTPALTSTIIIDGKDFTLQRDNSLNCSIDNIDEITEFRIIRVSSTANLTLQKIIIANGCVDSEVDGDTRSDGGGIFNQGILSLDNVTLLQNKAIFGGAIVNNFPGTILITNSSFLSNQAIEGSAIQNDTALDSIKSTTFAYNVSTFSGTIFNTGTINTIQNSTFSNNVMGGEGAIFNEATIGTILNCTFSGNSAGRDGAAITNEDTISSLENSLFHNNGIEGCTNSGTFSVSTNNLSDSDDNFCPGIASNLTTNTVGILADNGGKTLTHALLQGSEAINAAIAGTTGDQRDFAANGIRDIGAFEFEGLDPDIVFMNGFE